MSSVKLQYNTSLSDTGNLSYLNNGTLSLEIQSILDDIEQKTRTTITEETDPEDIYTKQHNNSLNDEEIDYYQEKIENHLESKYAYDRSAPIFQKLKKSILTPLNKQEKEIISLALEYILLRYDERLFDLDVFEYDGDRCVESYDGDRYYIDGVGDDYAISYNGDTTYNESMEKLLKDFHFSHVELAMIIVLYGKIMNESMDYFNYLYYKSDIIRL